MNRTLLPALLALTVALAGVSPPALGDRVAQSRRIRHFDVMKEHGIFASMSVVDGVPTLALTERRAQVEPESLRAFCRIVFFTNDPTLSHHSIGPSSVDDIVRIVQQIKGFY